jgi:hypothetical protein
MEGEDLLLHSQESVTCPYPKSDNPVRVFPSHFLKIHFNIILPQKIVILT